jgi:hypothetical protein
LPDQIRNDPADGMARCPDTKAVAVTTRVYRSIGNGRGMECGRGASAFFEEDAACRWLAGTIPEPAGRDT